MKLKITVLCLLLVPIPTYPFGVSLFLTAISFIRTVILRKNNSKIEKNIIVDTDNAKKPPTIESWVGGFISWCKLGGYEPEKIWKDIGQVDISKEDHEKIRTYEIAKIEKRFADVIKTIEAGKDNVLKACKINNGNRGFRLEFLTNSEILENSLNKLKQIFDGARKLGHSIDLNSHSLEGALVMIAKWFCLADMKGSVDRDRYLELIKLMTDNGASLPQRCAVLGKALEILDPILIQKLLEQDSGLANNINAVAYSSAYRYLTLTPLHDILDRLLDDMNKIDKAQKIVTILLEFGATFSNWFNILDFNNQQRILNHCGACFPHVTNLLFKEILGDFNLKNHDQVVRKNMLALVLKFGDEITFNLAEQAGIVPGQADIDDWNKNDQNENHYLLNVLKNVNPVCCLAWCNRGKVPNFVHQVVPSALSLHPPYADLMLSILKRWPEVASKVNLLSYVQKAVKKDVDLKLPELIALGCCVRGCDNRSGNVLHALIDSPKNLADVIAAVPQCFMQIMLKDLKDYNNKKFTPLDETSRIDGKNKNKCVSLFNVAGNQDDKDDKDDEDDKSAIVSIFHAQEELKRAKEKLGLLPYVGSADPNKSIKGSKLHRFADVTVHTQITNDKQ
jgi:hypothetical protein